MASNEFAAVFPGPAPGPCDRAARAAVLVDPRADDRRRRVEISPSRIVISRRVGAVAMRLALAPAAYRGVGLKVAERAEGVAYEICLTHRDSDFDAVLARCDESDEAIAEWRQWARWFALPALVEQAPGRFVARQELGATPGPRRRRHALRERRSRFALRRRMGEPAKMADIHRGEREIVCYE